MIIFLSVALTIYGVMHIYALSKVWYAFPHSTTLVFALFLTGVALTLSPFILWYLTRQNWHGAYVVISWIVYIWMGFLFLFCCTALVVDIGHLLSSILSFKWPFNISMTLLVTGLLSLSLMGYGFIEAKNIQIEKVNIITPKLASGQITIAHISDLHLGAMLGTAFLDGIIARLNEANPDIIVATGDVVDGQGDDLNKMAKRFLTLHPPKGLFAVTGNHEYFAGLENSLSFLRSAGFRVLRGESAVAGGIVLVGIDDPTARAMNQEVKLDTKQALASVTKSDFIVLLKHQPVVDTKTPFDLQLSGHVHGGQIFPFGLLTRLTYAIRTGLTQLADGRMLYVSRGTGTWGPPIRLFAAPEITLITISSENK
jgi:predicted MPP superfamily phosphohydrolase